MKCQTIVTAGILLCLVSEQTARAYNADESQAVIADLKPFLPQSDAREIPKSARSKSMKALDETIRPRRDLAKLQ